ncbi:hypothetical protein GPALN_011341 [Globodera pallida]|nr:hypothetical protein GPALN_011341 [Globodera pallida]
MADTAGGASGEGQCLRFNPSPAGGRSLAGPAPAVLRDVLPISAAETRANVSQLTRDAERGDVVFGSDIWHWRQKEGRTAKIDGRKERGRWEREITGGGDHPNV